MPVLALTLLTALAAVAAVGIVVRLRLAGRAEQLVAATLFWNALILAPIYALGWLHRLTAASLTYAASSVFLSAIVLASLGRAPKEHARAVGRTLLGLARLPLDALILAARPLGLTLVAVFLSEALIAWTAIGAYYAHQWRMWDSLWYHEPIVAFSIQHRGFEIVSLPDSLQRINSLPRAGEMTDLWFAIFGGRKLIDVANSLLAPALIASQYLLCARVARSRVVALGWACAFFLTPATAWQLGTCFVDSHVALALLAALAFAARPRVRLAHCAIAAVALTLAVGIKYPTLVPVAAIGLIVLVRTWASTGASVRGRVAVTLGGGGAILGFAASTYLRNLRAFRNPFWPYVVPGHPSWPGFAEPGQDVAAKVVSFGVSRSEALKQLFEAPIAAFNYGLGFAWITLPLFLLAAIVLGVHALAAAARAASRPVRATSDWRSVAWIVVLCGPAIAVAWTSPALDQGRYNLFVVGTMVTIIAWMSGASRLGGLAGDGAIGAASVMAVMSYADADPRFVLLPSELRALARLPAAEREVTPELGAATIREVGIARERELGPGDVVAFGDDYGGFVAELFNNEFSNRAIYVPDSSTFLKDAEAAGAKWVFCAPTSPCFDQVKLPDSGWTSVGRLHHNDDGAVYRRVAP